MDAAFLFQHACLNLDPGGAQDADAAARMLRVRIEAAYDYAPDAVADDRVAARRRTARGAARLQRDIQIGACGVGFVRQAQERFDLGMRSAAAFVVAASDDPSVAHDDSADCRIRAGVSCAEFRLAQSLAHKKLFVFAVHE